MLTYNHERYIAQAVESILMQETSHPYEIVIGEDCSTDATREIVTNLAKLHPKVIRLRLAKRNLGANKNFIRTVEMCAGQYVVILEGDDYWTSPRKLQVQIEALDAHRDWAICFHPAVCLYEDGSTGPTLFPDGWTKPVATLVDLFATNFVPTSGAMFRNRQSWPLPEWFAELSLGDWPLQILNASHGKIGFLPEPMSVYRIHSQGMWSSLALGSKLTSIFKMLTAVDHHFGGKYREEIDANRLQTVQWLASELHKARTMPKDSEAWESVYVQMLDDAQRLRAELDEVTQSVPYRVAREALRPLMQLWSMARRLRGIPEPEPKPLPGPPPSLIRAA